MNHVTQILNIGPRVLDPFFSILNFSLSILGKIYFSLLNKKLYIIMYTNKLLESHSTASVYTFARKKA